MPHIPRQRVKIRAAGSPIERAEKLRGSGRLRNTCESCYLRTRFCNSGSATQSWFGCMYHLIEKGLGWEHNVQFVCLAFQNAMTTQINGQQSIQCRALHEIIVNEVPQGKQGTEGH